MFDGVASDPHRCSQSGPMGIGPCSDTDDGGLIDEDASASTSLIDSGAMNRVSLDLPGVDDAVYARLPDLLYRFRNARLFSNAHGGSRVPSVIRASLVSTAGETQVLRATR